ncbi:MAG: carboxymuconolactone decarboxylase family protein [Rhodobacteraceae bacterium]|nr:carboxymuconolactone decarboxylase family protein [Paracoccaceae bacterium]
MRVQPKAIKHYPLFIRGFFAKQKSTYGEVLLPGMLWGRSKWVFASVALLYGALNRKSSPLDGVLRSIVTVRVSQINHCEFCVDINGATLQKRGASEEKMLALKDWRASGEFDDQERAVLAYTEAVTYTDSQITDEMMQALRVHFDDDGIVELTGMIAFQNLSSKFNAALNIPPQGFCELPNLKTDD